MSIPRVGSSKISTFEQAPSHLATTAFCWFPPESYLVKVYISGAFMLNLSIYFSSFIYVFLLQWLKNLRFLTHLVLSLDHLLVTFTIFVTGGILSVLSFLYPLLIITASILLYRRGGFLSASLSSILYGGLLDLEFYD